MTDHGDLDDDALDALLGAYALDAVDVDERRAIEEYISRDPRASAEVREHREVASMLAWSGSAAPEGLWDRIASSIEESPPVPSGELAQVLSMDHDSTRPRRSMRARAARAVGAWSVAAAAAAAIAVVAVKVADDGPVTPESALEQQVDDAFRDPGSTVVTLMSDGSGPIVRAVIEAGGRGYLVGSTLPALPADQTYQLWGVGADGEAISLGLLGRKPGTESFRAGDDVTALAVTAERSGGVITSTNRPVVVGDVG